MSEKLDEIIISNAEIKQSYSTLISLMKGFIAGCSLVIILFITFMISARSDIATIKATLATKDNIVKLEERLHNEMGVYISLASYLEIEYQRTLSVSDIICDLGRLVHIKDEELEKLRTTCIFKLNNNAKLGTIRSDKQ